jgi:hypothetical protein
MATISPAILATELRLRDKRQNYAGILDAVSLAKQETNAARGAALGNSVGQEIVGLESIVRVANNLVENVESTLKPVIAKVKDTGHDLEDTLKPLLSSSEITSLGAAMKNSAVTITDIFPLALTSPTVASEMNHKIITDASPDAAAAALKKAAALLDNSKLTTVIQGLCPDDLKSLGESAVEKMQSKEVQKNISNMLVEVETELKKATDGTDSGNLLKDISEDLTRNIGTSVVNFGEEFNRTLSLPIINDVLGGKNALGLDKAVSAFKIPDELIALNIGGTNISSLLNMQNFINRAEKLAPELNAITAQLKTKTDNAINILSKAKTSVAAQVTDGEDNQHEVSDVADTTKDSRFKTLSSIEEIISVLKFAERPITTIVWHWSGHYSEDGDVGAKEINAEYLRDNKKIPFHFVIAKNGDIQTGASIHGITDHVITQWQELSFGVAFVGGYNGARGAPRGVVNLDSKSYTAAQWRSYFAFMKAFYAFAPGGDAFGNNDLGADPGEGPGFSVPAGIAQSPFFRENACQPGIDTKFLTREQIIASQKIYSIAINELQDIQ